LGIGGIGVGDWGLGLVMGVGGWCDGGCVIYDKIF
jgi:hypothetical protein